MSNPRYPEEFKIQAVNQVTEKKLPVADVAPRLGVSTHSLYAWIKRYSKPQEERQQDDDQYAELRRLRAELKLVTEERDILKNELKSDGRGLCELDGSALDIVPCHSQVIGVLVEPMNQVQQSLAQHLILELLSSTHHIKRRCLIVGGNGVEQFAHAS